MTFREEQVRTAIIEQASDWFVANDAAALGAQESAALASWFKASPVHVEEFLGVAAVARDMQALGTEPELSIEALVVRAGADDGQTVSALFGALSAVGKVSMRRLRSAAIMATAIGAACLAVVWWSLQPATPQPPLAKAAPMHFSTRHGEQRTQRLTDGSALHLNTDSSVTVLYTQHERLVVLDAGEAAFEVTHESGRAFRVLAGPAAVVDLGTRFAVRLRPGSAVVTVLSGRVAVESARFAAPQQRMQLSTNQQVSVTEGQWPSVPTTVDAQRSTAWLHRQIAFDHEPLARVAAEFNRYALKPIEITAPQLQDLEVSGVFSTDDAEELLAFLRSLDGVRIEVTETRIRVSQR